MCIFRNLKGILFDSGRVLNSPRTGHWFIPPNFFKYVDKEKFNLLSEDTVGRAFQRAFQYLSQQNFILTETEEFEHFIEFYKLFSNELPSLELSQTDVLGIASDTVYNDDKFYFYDDVFETIPKLSKNYKLGIVSDTWVSLHRVFKNIGLRNYFSTFVMSSIVGVVKPHDLMFNTALSELKIKPEEALFIDDSIVNVKSAKKMGLNAILMARGEKSNLDMEPMKIGQLDDLFVVLDLDKGK